MYIRLFNFLFSLFVFIFMISACEEENKAPILLPLQEISVMANEAINLQIFGSDGNGDSLAFSFNLNPPPQTQTQGLTSIPRIQSLSATQALFQWVPGIADVGLYELTIIVSDGQSQVQESIRLEVKSPTLTQSTALFSFALPQGTGKSFDLTSENCLSFDVEIKADSIADSDLKIQLSADLENARLSPPSAIAGKKKSFEFCPSQTQLEAQQRYLIEFEAYQFSNPSQKITKRYLLRLDRNLNQINCPNNPPTIQHSPIASIENGSNQVLALTVLDDLGIKSAPLFAYVVDPITDPRENPKGIDWQLIEFSRNGDACQVQFPSLNLSAPTATLYYQIVVTDNDDPNGALCDHTTKSPIYPVTILSSQSRQNLPYCASCTDSNQCGTDLDLCLAFGDGQYCAQDCRVNPCPNGADCLDIQGLDGQNYKQCVPSTLSCVGTCVPDAFDLQSVDLLSIREQPKLASGRYPNLSICAQDIDLYLIDLPPATGLQVSIAFQDAQGDLDLYVSVEDNAQGEPTFAYQSANADQDLEQVQITCPRSIQALVAVQAYEGAINQNYEINVGLMAEMCDDQCSDDAYENTDIPIESGNYSRLVICPNDKDDYFFEAQADQIISIFSRFDAELGTIEMLVFDPNDDQIARSYAAQDEAFLEVKTRQSGLHRLQIQSASPRQKNEYQLNLLVFDAQSCESTMDCRASEYCVVNLGACLDRTCDSYTGCSLGHQCAIAQNEQIGECLAECLVDSDCRAGENCKRLSDYQRLCATDGNLLLGSSCRKHADCADQLACTQMPNGAKCFSGGCDQGLSCPGGQICTNIQGFALCLPPCDFGCPAGLSCQNLGGRQVCAP
jgi:hypothetical protein